MNSEVKSLIVSIFALAIAGGFSAYSANEVIETKADIKEQTSATNDNAEILVELQKDVSSLRKTIPKPQNLDDLYDADDEIWKRLTLIEQNLNATHTQVTGISNELIVAKASLNKLSQATPQGKEMYSLQLLKSDGQTALDREYLQSETVYVTGKYDGPASKFDILFKRAGQQVQSNTGLGIPSDGIFSYVFNTGHNQALGSYTVTVIINGKSDTISFEIV